MLPRLTWWVWAIWKAKSQSICSVLRLLFIHSSVCLGLRVRLPVHHAYSTRHDSVSHSLPTHLISGVPTNTLHILCVVVEHTGTLKIITLLQNWNQKQNKSSAHLYYNGCMSNTHKSAWWHHFLLQREYKRWHHHTLLIHNIWRKYKEL